jgi:triacylglycerol lipase
MANERPVVLVHGMFGFGPRELGSLQYWGTALEAVSPLQRIEASVGPLSSPHDRACELAAQLKGVRVDYGEVHAAAHGHERFGRDYRGQGLAPGWDSARPLHFVGHSLGAPTIRALQGLLEADYWNWGSSAAWIASISSISGPHNGTTTVYLLGADTNTGLLRRGSGITPLLRLLALYDGLTEDSLSQVYDFDLGHWGFERNAGEPLESYLRRICDASFLWGADNAFYSISLQGAQRANQGWRTYPTTYYLSIVTESTFRWRPRGFCFPSPLMHAALTPFAWQIGRFRLSRLELTDQAGSSWDWWENDGLVPAYSQLFPRNGQNPYAGTVTADTLVEELRPGHWHGQWQRGLDHADIVGKPRWWLRKRQRRFYERLFRRLAQLTPLSLS